MTATTSEVIPENSDPGSVVLDIGGDVGAAIVVTPRGLAGSEIEVRRAGAAWEGEHVAVIERRLPSGPVYAAVFPALHAGLYEVRVRRGGDDQVPTAVAVAGGSVTRTTLYPTGLEGA